MNKNSVTKIKHTLKRCRATLLETHSFGDHDKKNNYPLLHPINIDHLGSPNIIYPMDFKMHRDGKGTNPREHR